MCILQKFNDPANALGGAEEPYLPGMVALMYLIPTDLEMTWPTLDPGFDSHITGETTILRDHAYESCLTIDKLIMDSSTLKWTGLAAEITVKEPFDSLFVKVTGVNLVCSGEVHQGKPADFSTMLFAVSNCDINVQRSCNSIMSSDKTCM